MPGRENALTHVDMYSTVAKTLRDVEALATGRPDFDEWCQRSDNPAYTCKRTELSPLRFLFASSFDDVVSVCILRSMNLYAYTNNMKPTCMRMLMQPWRRTDEHTYIHVLAGCQGGNCAAQECRVTQDSQANGPVLRL